MLPCKYTNNSKILPKICETSSGLICVSFFIGIIANLIESLPNKQIIFPMQAKTLKTYLPQSENIFVSKIS